MDVAPLIPMMKRTPDLVLGRFMHQYPSKTPKGYGRIILGNVIIFN